MQPGLCDGDECEHLLASAGPVPVMVSVKSSLPVPVLSPRDVQ